MKRLMLALTMGLAVLACTPDQKMENPGETPVIPDTPDTPDTPEHPEEPDSQLLDCYVLVAADKTDWTGDYLIAAEDRNGKEVVFAKWSHSRYGQPAGGINLTNLKDKEGRIAAEKVEDFKSIITLREDKYSIYVSKVGYIGVEKNHNLARLENVTEEEAPKAERFHWTITFDQTDQVPVICNFESDNMQLLWNDAPDCFRFGTYPSAHDDIRPVHLYERVQLELSEK